MSWSQKIRKDQKTATDWKTLRKHEMRYDLSPGTEEDINEETR
jgi:hypothetical protein